MEHTFLAVPSLVVFSAALIESIELTLLCLKNTSTITTPLASNFVQTCVVDVQRIILLVVWKAARIDFTGYGDVQAKIAPLNA